MSAKQWESEEVKGFDLDDRLNSLQSQGYTIFSVLSGSRGVVTDYVRIVYFREAR